MMTPAEVAKLLNAKPNGKGWTAHCPAHDDRNPSVSIDEGDDGRTLLNCFAGCRVNDILAALDLEMRDIMPEAGRVESKCNSKAPKRNGKAESAFSSAQAAIEALTKRYGEPVRQWEYSTTQGDIVGYVLRWNTPDGKRIRPVSRIGDTWQHKAMPTPRPLYNLSDIQERANESVIVVEGEKCAVALAKLRMLATTSAGGSSAARQSDWQPLAGREVCIMPDNDNSGEKYARDVIEMLAALNPQPTVKRVALPGLVEGEDVADYIASRRAAGLDDDAIRAELTELIARAEPVELADVEPVQVARWRPFPTDELPLVLARFTRETAEAIGCDEAMLALPALAACGGAIGTTRAIELKPTWSELPIIWDVVVARSGTLKSPAHDAAVKPLRDAQSDAMREYCEAIERYNLQLREFDALSKRDKSQTDEPRPPVPRRFLCSDITAEAVAGMLENNPRGLLLGRDELSGWVLSHNQYKSRGGADLASWLEMHRGGNVMVDRKTGDKRTISVPRAAVSICGTIQPGVLCKVLTGEHWESGLVARLLMARPPERRKRWTERTPAQSTVNAYSEAVRSLLQLQPCEGGAPVLLPLTSKARELWHGWYDKHAERQADAGSDSEAAMLAKIEAYAARFALICTLTAEPNATAVDEVALRRGCILADWFADEGLRLNAELAGDEADDESREHRALVARIERKGGAITPSELLRASRDYSTVKEAKEALDELVKALLGSWEHPPPGRKGGRPTERFRLAQHPGRTETPAGGPENEGLGCVDTIDASRELAGCGADEWARR